MTVAIKIALWAALAFPLWLLLSAALLEAAVPMPRLVGAVLGWVAAGLLLAWALPALSATAWDCLGPLRTPSRSGLSAGGRAQCRGGRR